MADNDHVDVHLLLTRGHRIVSQRVIKICENIVMMFPPLRMEGGRFCSPSGLDSPHVCGIVLLTIWCGFVFFFGKKVKSNDEEVSDEDLE